MPNQDKVDREMEEVNYDNDEYNQDQSFLGAEEGENSLQDEPDMCTQASDEKG